MSDPKAPCFPGESLVTSPGPVRGNEYSSGGQLHRGVEVLGENGDEGPKAFYIHIEARPGKEEAVIQMLRDIHGCVLGEPATGPWFGVRYSATTFGIFEAFPSIAGRDAHVAGGGGDIFRDRSRMNEILAYPAQVHRVDVLLVKDLFAG
ncbi:putative quinol monooxygenase [Pseudomonas sp. YH-1]|uniref:putative quinol monooxygenase n=1 Tax=Pseudomonas sp. YH-1 TaxID=3384787 RepID=UPI003F81718C